MLSIFRSSRIAPWSLHRRNFSSFWTAIHNRRSGTGSGHSFSGILVTFWREDRQNIGLPPYFDGRNWLDPEPRPRSSTQRPVALGGHHRLALDYRKRRRDTSSSGLNFGIAIGQLFAIAIVIAAQISPSTHRAAAAYLPDRSFALFSKTGEGAMSRSSAIWARALSIPA